jgi:hypothetical protein
VQVTQGLEGKWTMVNESAAYTRWDASHIRWDIPVPAGGKVPLRYTVDFRD